MNGGAGVMVFLSAPLWLRNRITDRYWRVQEVLKHARVSVPRAPLPAPLAGPACAGPADRILSRFLTSTSKGGRIGATGWPSGL